VQKGNNVNGFSSGRKILISEATVTRLNEDEFALIIGHEIAHIYLGHTEQTVRNELNADWLGAELACNAGFDLGRGVKVFRFLRKSRVHPHYRERQDLLASLITRCGNSRSAI
jgi:predicted Zn-dependent protease